MSKAKVSFLILIDFILHLDEINNPSFDLISNFFEPNSISIKP